MKIFKSFKLDKIFLLAMAVPAACLLPSCGTHTYVGKHEFFPPGTSYSDNWIGEANIKLFSRRKKIYEVENKDLIISIYNKKQELIYHGNFELYIGDPDFFITWHDFNSIVISVSERRGATAKFKIRLVFNNSSKKFEEAK